MKRIINILFLVAEIGYLASSAQTTLNTKNTLVSGDSLFNKIVMEPKEITKKEFEKHKSLKINCRVDSSGFLSGYGLYRTDTCHEICKSYLVEKKSGKKMWLPSSYDSGIMGLLLSPTCKQFIVYSSFDGPDYNRFYEYRAEVSGFTIAPGEGLKTIKSSFQFSTINWSIEEVIWVNEYSIAFKTYNENRNTSNQDALYYKYFKITIKE